MDQGWKIIYYKNTQGRFPVFDFIENLDEKAKAKISNTLDLLKEFGIRLGLPHVKKVTGTVLWELRILGSDSIRIFYIAVTGKSFLLLHGFKKKKQKTDTKEIKIAAERLRNYKTAIN